MYSVLQKRVLLGGSAKPLPIKFTSTNLSKLNKYLSEKPNGCLFDQFAITTHFLRCGNFPLSLDDPPTEAKTTITGDKTPSAKAERILSWLVENKYIDESIDCLHQLQKNGISIPYSLISSFIEITKTHSFYSPIITDSFGTRGTWLAENLKSWRLPSVIEREKTWENGSKEQRRSQFLNLRITSPETATGLLLKTLNEEQPGDLAYFTSCMVTGISDFDRQLIEKLANNTNFDVRYNCCVLMVLLEDNDLISRILPHVLSLFDVSNRSGKVKVTCSIPTEFQQAWDQLGISEKSKYKASPQSSWLSKLLCLLPPSLISNELSIELRDLHKAIETSAHSRVFLSNLRTSARLHIDLPYIKLDIRNLGLEQFVEAVHFYGNDQNPDICRLMTEQCEHFIILLLKDRTTRMNADGRRARYLNQLFKAIGPLSSDFSARLLDEFILPREENLSTSRGNQFNLRSMYRLLTISGNYDRITLLVKALNNQTKPQVKTIEPLRFRLAFHKEIIKNA